MVIINFHCTLQEILACFLLFLAGNKWKCDACMIQNDSDKDTCVACQSKRPGGSKPADTAQKSDLTGRVFD